LSSRKIRRPTTIHAPLCGCLPTTFLRSREVLLIPPITPHPDDPVRLDVRPEGLNARLRFNLIGRPLLWSAVQAPRLFLRTPDAGRRSRLQRAIGSTLLKHLQVQLDVQGLEHLGPGPFLIVALHEGIADVLCLLQLPLPMRFVARREIFRWPSLGPLITQLGHVAIDPETQMGGFRELLRAADRILGAGESLGMFPQGTVAGIESDFQRGVFEVARRLGVSILPVALSGSHRIWEHPFSPTLRYGQRVTLQVLEPVHPEVFGTESVDEVRVRIRRAMKAAALLTGAATPRRFDPDRDGYWDGYRLDIDPDFPAVARQIARHRAALLGSTA
jgi:1-acyl-sn-glycerol-3-phosphate acyltransferase